MSEEILEGQESEEQSVEETEESSERSEESNPTSLRASGNLNDDDIGRTDDPVRMYLREMGSVELLSREGEIAIAKRIEAGREKMISALCESPLTMRAIAHWHDALVDGELLLRDVIDLDATYGGDEPDENMLKAAEGDDGEADIGRCMGGEGMPAAALQKKKRKKLRGAPGFHMTSGEVRDH